MKSIVKRLVMIAIIPACMFMPEKGKSQGENSAQRDSTQQFLTIVNTKTNERVLLPLGQPVTYKLRSSDDYHSAKPAGGSDSTILFEDENQAVVSVRLQDLHLLKIPRSKSRRTSGTVITVIGSLAVFVGIVSVATPKAESDASGVDETLHDASAIIGAIGLPVLAAGLAMKSPRKIDFVKSPWKLNVGSSGNSAQATPASGEPQRFKVAFTMGLATGSSISPTAILAVEPGYRIAKSWGMGIRLEDLFLKGKPGGLGGTYPQNPFSYTISIQHYFLGDKIVPYIGAGFGIFSGIIHSSTFSGNGFVSTEPSNSDFGFYPRVGFEAGHFTMSAEFNLVKDFNYLGLKAGFFVGGRSSSP